MTEYWRYFYMWFK